jgi:hypothetical protein
VRGAASRRPSPQPRPMRAELETRWAPRSAQAATAFHVRMKTNLSPTSSLATIAVTTKTASANPFRESCGVSVYRGGRKKKLNASMLAIETPIAYASPYTTATG